MNTVPKFGKVELLVKKPAKLGGVPYTDRVEFLDCGLMITGDYIVVIIDEKDEKNKTLTSTGEIFPMSIIKSYKTHAS